MELVMGLSGTTLCNTNAQWPEPFLTEQGIFRRLTNTKSPKYNTWWMHSKPNGYTDQFLKSCQRTKPPKAFNQPLNNQPQSHRGFVTLPYFQGISEKIARTLGQFDVNVAHKPVKTVGSILKKPKDKFDQDLSTRVVYKIHCKNCENFTSVKHPEQ